jgi:prepilin-type N-terminal cleavage/methylation domain-containing protein/prepilin-type processing-associated H-X9-DG protein
MRAQNAFTLIELLVVIAIIALLVSILLPSLNRAKQLAKATVCLSNGRNLAVATLIYAQENRQFLPSVGLSHGSHVVDEQGSWFHLLMDYAGSRLLYRCPSDESPWFDQPLPGGRLRKVGFATNYYVSGQMVGWEEYGSLDKIRMPMQTIFAVELTEGRTLAQQEWAAADHIHADLWLSDPEPKAREQVAIDRHLGRANYVFLDSHAQSLEFEETYRIGAGSTLGNINWAANKYDPTVAK